MVLVIIGSLVTACLFLFQGVHIFRNGSMRPFFEQSGDPRGSQSKLKFAARVAAGLLYTFPSVAILCILTIALLENDTHRLIDWLSGRVIGLVGGLFLLTYGLTALLRPDVVLKWVRSVYPDHDLAEQNPSVRRFTRALGAFVSAFGLLIFNRL